MKKEEQLKRFSNYSGVGWAMVGYKEKCWYLHNLPKELNEFIRAYFTILESKHNSRKIDHGLVILANAIINELQKHKTDEKKEVGK